MAPCRKPDRGPFFFEKSFQILRPKGDLHDGTTLDRRAACQPLHGPQNARGKRVCALNAYRHGLTGQLNILTPDEQQAYDHHSKITLEALAPASDYERDLAQSIADDRWRLKRARTIESGMFAIGMQLGAAMQCKAWAPPRSTTPWRKPAPGCRMPAISNSSPSMSSASAAAWTRLRPSSKLSRPAES